MNAPQHGAATPEQYDEAAPLAPPVTEAQHQSESPPHGAAPCSPRQCLVVDDSRMIRKVSRRIVESLGYQVSEVENGQEALARCQAAMPDLILLDWNMPVMSGLDFVTALRAMNSTKHARVVFCTSVADQFNVHKGFEAGADEFVTKPFDAETLLAKLHRIGAA